MIKIDNLHKAFAKNKVLQGIDLEINTPGITAILGPNGSGKTTLVKCFLGMVRPSKGNVFFNEVNIKKQFAYREKISYLSQIARFPENLSSEELIHMVKDLRKGETNEDYFIELFGLRNELKKKMSNLSGGTRQKVNLTLSLMYDSQLIILDEPTTGLDPLALIRLKSHLQKEKEAGKHILITTHIMSFVEELADNVIFLLEGKIYFNGKLETLLEQYQEKKLEKAIATILQNHLN